MRSFNTLFIAGNGFDIAHDLKTSYNHFKEYITQQYGEFNGYFIPDTGVSQHGDDAVASNDAAQVLMGALETVKDPGPWNMFEDLLEEIDLHEFYDSVELPQDSDGLIHPHARYVLEDESFGLRIALSQIGELLAEWLETTVDVQDLHANGALAPVYDLQKLLSGNSGYLSFNYTDTLEEVYDVSDVLHIHGSVSRSELIVGSQGVGASRRTGWHQWDDEIDSAHHRLQKDVAKQLKLHSSFFDKIDASTTRVVSVGFSMGKADTGYLTRICKELRSTAEWYVSEHEYEECHGEPFKRKCYTLRAEGFTGSIGYFKKASGEFHIVCDPTIHQ